MNVAHLAVVAAALGALQAPSAKFLTGTLNERLVAEGALAQIELKPSANRDLPGVAAGAEVFAAAIPQFHALGAGDGFRVALATTEDGWLLFVDSYADGRF